MHFYVICNSLFFDKNIRFVQFVGTSVGFITKPIWFLARKGQRIVYLRLFSIFNRNDFKQTLKVKFTQFSFINRLMD